MRIYLLCLDTTLWTISSSKRENTPYIVFPFYIFLIYMYMYIYVHAEFQKFLKFRESHELMKVVCSLKILISRNSITDTKEGEAQTYRNVFCWHRKKALQLWYTSQSYICFHAKENNFDYGETWFTSDMIYQNVIKYLQNFWRWKNYERGNSLAKDKIWLWNTWNNGIINC